MNAMNKKFNTERYVEAIELAIAGYIIQLSSEDLLKLSDTHFDMFDYGMIADRIIDKELIEREK